MCELVFLIGNETLILMQYELIPPLRPLNRFVQYGCRLENKMDSTHPETLWIVADGCPGILYAQSGEEHEYGPKLTQRSLYGQSDTSQHSLL